MQSAFDLVGSEATEADRCTAQVLDQIRGQKIRPAQRLGEVAFARKLKTGRAAVRLRHAANTRPRLAAEVANWFAG